MKPFHFAAYSESLGSVTNSDLNAASDEVIQVRNSHLIFSEPYDVIAAYPNGDTLERVRFGNIALQYRGIQHLFPVNQDATIISRPEVSEYLNNRLRLPVNEEITLEATTNAVGPANANVGLWLAKPEWNPAEPFGEDIGWVRGTVVIAAGAANAWTAPVAIVLERDLFNGVYAVVGAQVVAPNAEYFRMQFRTQDGGNGRQHRPGGLVMNSLADVPWYMQSKGLGEWGRFATYELPSIQTFEDTAGGTYEVRLRLKYLGESTSRLYQ